MPPPEQPPEYERLSTRGIFVAILGLLAAYHSRYTGRAADVLLHAPVKYIQGATPLNSPLASFETNSIKELYEDIRRLLDDALEEDSNIIYSQKMFERQKRDKTLIEELIAYVSRSNPRMLFARMKWNLTDKSFIDRFGYNALIHGLGSEVLALLPASNDTDHPPLFLGMTVSYTKRLEPSGQTGPLAGTGKITAFLIPSREQGVIPDHVIRLEIKTEEGVVATLLSPNEVSVG